MPNDFTEVTVVVGEVMKLECNLIGEAHLIFNHDTESKPLSKSDASSDCDGAATIVLPFRERKGGNFSHASYVSS